MNELLAFLMSLITLLTGGGGSGQETAPTPPPVAEAVASDWCAEYLGDWVLWDDGVSSLRVESYGPEGIHFSVGFFRLAGFDAVTDGSNSRVCIFTGIDDPAFTGQIAFEADSITLYTFDHLGIFDGWFDSRVFTFRRAADPGVILTPEETEAAVAAIREAYYSPTAADSRLALPANAEGYARDFTYRNGEPVFAFVYRGTEEHRFYFLNGRLIRYIDENHIVYDQEALLPFTPWADEIYREAWENAPQTPVSGIPDWVGTWVSDGGESLVVTQAGVDSLTLTYNGYTASGESMFHSEYTLYYDDPEKTSASEPETVLLTTGWRYTVVYHGDHITLRSRYPDKEFYRQ